MLKFKDANYSYIVMGAGGTGSWLASFLSKIDGEVFLIDGDTVEPKNVLRQNFTENDVNGFKAEIIGTRYNQAFINEFMTDGSIIEEIIESLEPGTIPVIVGCLDNNGTRKIAHDVFVSDKYSDIIWVDSGNAERHGQTYVAAKIDGEIKYKSPIDLDPAFQNFDGDERRPDQISCAEHSESAPQNVTANVTAATVLFDVLNLIVSNKLLLGNKFSFDTRFMKFTVEEIL